MRTTWFPFVPSLPALSALASLVLSGCYLQHGVHDGADTGVDASTAFDRDARVARDAALAPLDAGDDRCLRGWRVTDEQELESAEGPTALGDAEWTGDGYLLVYTVGLPATASVVQLVRFGAPATPAIRVLGALPRSGWYSHPEIAVSADHVGVLRADSRSGCLFRRLGRDGTPTAPERRVDERLGGVVCSDFNAGREGFFFFEGSTSAEDPGTFFSRLDRDGRRVGESRRLDVFRDFISYHTHSLLDDGSTFVVGAGYRSDVLSEFAAQRIGVDGAALRDEVPVPEIMAPATVLRSLSTARGVLVGWTETGADSSTQLRLLWLSPDGSRLGEPFTLPVRASSRGGLGMIEARGEVLIAYVERGPDDLPGEGESIRVVRLDESDRLRGEPVLVDSGATAGLVMRTNGRDVLLAYSEPGTAPSTSIRAVQLSCQP